MRRRLLLAAVAMSVACVVARADDEGTLLRYKWIAGQQMTVDVSVNTKGIVTMASPAGKRTVNTDVRARMSMFSKVEKVTPAGWAKLKVSFGLIGFDTTAPNGTAVHGLMNPANNTLEVTANGEKRTRKMPAGTLDLLAKGLTPTLDNRGQMKSFPEAAKMQKALAAATGGNGAGNLGSIVTGLAPLLPEKPVKIGDVWDKQVRVGKWTGKAGSQRLTMHFKYVGDEDVNGVPCRHLTATVNLANLNFTVPQVAGMTVKISLENYSTDSSMDYYMSKTDTHLVQAKMDSIESGTVHTQGTKKGPNGEDVAVDQSITLQDYKVTIEMKRR